MSKPETKAVMNWLSENTRPEGEMCSSFSPIIRDLSLERKAVRRACRLLTRQGLAEFHSALWDEDGEPRGSGYCISSEGLAIYNDDTDAADRSGK